MKADVQKELKGLTGVHEEEKQRQMKLSSNLVELTALNTYLFPRIEIEALGLLNNVFVREIGFNDKRVYLCRCKVKRRSSSHCASEL